MRAAIVKNFGRPSTIVMADVERPTPEPDQVLVRVRAAAVNRIDISTRNGNLARAGLLAEAQSYSLGWDVAGSVEAIGTEVRRFAPGDRVVGLRDVLSDPGTHADFVALHQNALAPAPKSVSYAEAAALPLAGLTATGALRLADVRAGEWLLVTGAGGGVGRIGVELAALHGVRVIAYADQSDAEDLLARGAERVLTRGADIPREVRRIIPLGVDAVIDGAVLGVRAHEALRGEGTFVVLVAPFAPPALRGTRILGQEVHADGGALAILSTLVDAGHLTLRVAGTHALEGVADAHAALEAGGVRGRVVLVP